jgi:hypothetical protein
MTPNVQTAYEAWTTPTDLELQTGDPVAMVPRLMAAYGIQQGELLRLLTANVTRLSDEIASVSDFMNVINTGMGYLKNRSEGDAYYVGHFATQAEADAEVARWVAIGAQPVNSDGSMGVVARNNALDVDPNDPTKTWGVFFQKAGGEAIQKRLQNRVNDLTTANQQAQLVLQTVIGRYNATIELISNIIKKNSTQLESIQNNFRR